MYFVESNADCFLPNRKRRRLQMNDYMIEQLAMKGCKSAAIGVGKDNAVTAIC